MPRRGREPRWGVAALSILGLGYYDVALGASAMIGVALWLAGREVYVNTPWGSAGMGADGRVRRTKPRSSRGLPLFNTSKLRR